MCQLDDLILWDGLDVLGQDCYSRIKFESSVEGKVSDWVYIHFSLYHIKRWEDSKRLDLAKKVTVIEQRILIC